MEQPEFLNNNVFTDLKKLNVGADHENVDFFSESDFKVVLQRVEHLGIGIYTIETLLNGDSFEVAKHHEHKKKATDPKWYKKAFLTFTKRQPELLYSATYKVSNKLLAR